jgi:hypothetical protein
MVVDNTWVDVGRALVTERAGDRSLAEGLAGQVLMRVLVWGGRYQRRALDRCLSEMRRMVLGRLLQDMKEEHGGLAEWTEEDAVVLPEGREKIWRVRMRCIFLISDLEKDKEGVDAESKISEKGYEVQWGC